MYLVTGCNGQLGSELRKILPDAIFADRHDLDITDADAVNRFVHDHGIDTIINCAAYTAVDRAESDVEMAKKVNVDGPHNLARAAKKIIHISTDYVFDGLGHRPYTPDDTPCPTSVYGQTKWDGERAVLDHAECAIIIRTAWLYSIHGNNFVKTMRKLGAEKESIGVVSDQVGTPTAASDLAAAIVKIIPQMNKSNRGIYHYTNAGVCSWYDLAVAVMDMSGLMCDVQPITTAQYPTPAARPAYSVLDKTKIIQTFGVIVPHWQRSLEKCLKQF